MRPAITPREMQIWSMVVDGRTKKEIACNLGRSYHTVNQLYRNLYQKLNICKETDLVREWFIYHAIVTKDELSRAIRHHAAPAIMFFLMITAAQITLDTPAVRARTTSRTVSRTSSRSGSRRKKATYYA